jgi:hypothetical protein
MEEQENIWGNAGEASKKGKEKMIMAEDELHGVIQGYQQNERQMREQIEAIQGRLREALEERNQAHRAQQNVPTAYYTQHLAKEDLALLKLETYDGKLYRYPIYL